MLIDAGGFSVEVSLFKRDGALRRFLDQQKWDCEDRLDLRKTLKISQNHLKLVGFHLFSISIAITVLFQPALAPKFQTKWCGFVAEVQDAQV